MSTEDIPFGDPSQWSFDVGVAISVYQNSGGPNTQWETFERQKRWFGRPTIAVRLSCCMSTGQPQQLCALRRQAARAASLKAWPLRICRIIPGSSIPGSNALMQAQVPDRHTAICMCNHGSMHMSDALDAKSAQIITLTPR